MQKIEISNEIKAKCPDIRLACIQCKVIVSDENEDLWREIDAAVSEIQGRLSRDQISAHPVIKAARRGYKALGKDPARYRLSAEALLRRVLGGKSLYRINNIVDLLNLVSIKTGFSIGGYDADRISGKAVLGVGKEGEPYQGIGRGVLNIASLPVLRDDLGAFGSPTSDSSRTLVGNATKNFLMVFFDLGRNEEIDVGLELANSLLLQYGNASDIKESHA